MWLPSSIIINSTGPLTSRAKRSASAGGMTRSLRPLTIKIGQVMSLRDAFERQRQGVLARFLLLAQWLRTRNASRVNSGRRPRPAPVERPTERDAGLDAFVKAAARGA